ncbi:MAG: putative glycoside hydrolase [Methanobrevibacter sp.]|nr:putative glycoside hydrolase [Methanobrevibacter sp.]
MFSKKLKILLLFSLVLLIGSSFSFAENTNTNVASLDSVGLNDSDNSMNLKSSNLKSDDSSQGIDKTNPTVEISSKSKILAAGGDVRPSKLSQTSILTASATVNSYTKKNGKLPTYVTISGYNYSMPEFLYLLSKTIQARYKKSNAEITPIYSIKDPVNPTGANIKGKILVKDYYNHALSIANYNLKHNIAPTYVTTKLGRMQYQTTIYSFVKILAWSRANKNVLPVYVSLNVKTSHSLNKNLPKYSNSSSNTGTSSGTTSTSSSLSQSLIWAASKSVKNYVEANGKLPNYVTISNKQYSIPDFMNLVSRAIVLKNSGSNSNVAIKLNVKNPSKPSGVSINKNIPKATFVTLAKNIHNYIAKNNEAPNFVSSSYGKIQYQAILYGFAKVGNYIGANNKLPAYLSLNVKSTSSLNKNLPNHSNSGNSVNNGSNSVINSSANKNAIWVNSGDMKGINFDALRKHSIGNIFIHEDIFKNKTSALNWISTANNNSIKVHVWFTCFYNTSSKSWINPINTNTKTYNQAYFNTIIARAKEYASYNGVAGIHLDYLRYPGSDKISPGPAYSYSYSNGVSGVNAITEFTKQLSTSVKGVNNKLILSAAVMPETTNNAKYYGQDCSQLGKYLDVICPMIYKGNYKQNTSWIQNTTQWFVKNSGNAQIWGGIQTYRSDSDLTNLSPSELDADKKAVMDGGADGFACFRWGLYNFP